MSETATPSERLGPELETGGAASWPLERVLFLIAGCMTLLSALLAVTVSAWFLLLTAFVGVNQLIYVASGACPASLVLSRFGFVSCGASR